MNFFNMGPGELIFILVLALLIFGPRRLPELARDLGKAVRNFQQASQQLTGELTKEMEQATKAMDEAQQAVTGTVSEAISAAGTERAAAAETPRATDVETRHPPVSVTPLAGEAEPSPSSAPEDGGSEPTAPDDTYTI